MNKVVLLGRMARDPEVRYTQSAEPLAVCSFSLAVDKPYSRNRQEGEPTADFINCVCFGKRGENIGQYFRKGSRIAISGRIQTRNYTDQQGNKRYITEVVAEDFDFCESRSGAASGSGAPAPQYTPQPNGGSAPDGFFFSEGEGGDNGDDKDLPWF